jgi:hypothetical protein
MMLGRNYKRKHLKRGLRRLENSVVYLSENRYILYAKLYVSTYIGCLCLHAVFIMVFCYVRAKLRWNVTSQR